MLGQHAGDVERHVAGPDDGDLLGLERPGARVVRVRVVPGHEVRSAMAPRQVDPGDGQLRIANRTGGDDDGVVVLAELLDREAVLGVADLDVPEQADVTAGKDLVQRTDDGLDPRVIGGDAVPNEPVRRRKSIEEVDARARKGAGKDVGGVDAGWAGTDHGNTKSHVEPHRWEAEGWRRKWRQAAHQSTR